MLKITDANGGQMKQIPVEGAYCVGVFRDMSATVPDKKEPDSGICLRFIRLADRRLF